MTNTTPARVRQSDALATVLSLGLGLAIAPGHAAQSTVEPSAMISTPSASETLSAKQQAIPLVAAAMATSNMPKLNAALNQGLDAGLTISEARKSSCSFTPTPAFRAASMRWANC